MTPENFAKVITTLTNSKKLWIGFSGGLDSHVLLDLTARAFAMNSNYQIGAIHIHHGLSKNADLWVAHCEKIAKSLQIPFVVLRVDASVQNGESPEEQARLARNKAFQNFLKPDECLLLAHHENDQAETILLRLLRGAGPLGLGGMQSKTMLGKNELLRPLLNNSKESILAYAKERSLNWIEDESNHNQRFDRNYLRQEIMPLLEARWPKMARSINRTGNLCYETAEVLQAIAGEDILTVEGDDPKTLSVSKLLKLETFRRREVIRIWLQKHGFSFPSLDHMERIDREILNAKPGSKPRLKIGEYEIIRQKDILNVMLFTNE